MESPTPDALIQADELVRSGKPELAQAVLSEYLRNNPSSEQAWLLLSQVIDDPQKQIDSLMMVLRINPHHDEARNRLALLLASTPPELDVSGDVSRQQFPLADDPSIQPDNDFLAGLDFVELTVPPFSSLQTDDMESDLPERGEYEASFYIPDPTPPHIKPSTAVPPSAGPRRQASARGKAKIDWRILAAGLFVGLLIIIATIITIIALRDNLESSLYSTQVASLVTTQPRQVLPPTWTHTPTLLPSSTPTATPTLEPTPTPTLPAPAPTAAAQMETIQKQVSDLRGLQIQRDVSRFIVNPGVAEQVLTTYLIDSAYEAELRDQARILTAFGLIKPTYDMVKYALNSIVDNIGGVYVPWKKEIFVIGLRFSGIEHYVYSHEFDHALVDQHFHLDALGVYPYCLSNSQRCSAIQALVEGDATLLMSQWLVQYATPQDYRDILNYRPPLLAIPEEFPPPFVSRDVSFPYTYGYEFVQYLYDRGNWARVNQAYRELPDSTEQIMHPEKYLTNETPVEVADLPLSDGLSAEWRILKRDVLGEWMTYLILGYGADLAAQQEDSVASNAAAGWGGDVYQIYISDTTSDVVLSAHWVWDSQSDATQFQTAMLVYLDQRFRGSKLQLSKGACWQAGGQTSCLYSQGTNNLWLMAPDEATIEQVLSLYPGFE